MLRGRLGLGLGVLVAIATGCGARTGDDVLPIETGGGAGFGGGSGGSGGVGATGGVGGGGFGGGGFGGGGFGGGGFGGGGFGGGGFGGGGFGGGGFGGGGFGGGGFGGGGFGGGGSGGTGGWVGSCCVQHQTPGCQNVDVAQCVCANDPFCCNVAWDQACVSEVTGLGCGTCGGTGGSGGVGGFGGAGGSGGGVICGGQLCTSLSVAGFELPGCCPATNPSMCGLDVTQIQQFVPLPPGCVERGQPGKPDPSCPPITVAGNTLAGCCKPSGLCGHDFSPIDLGCVETWQWGGPPPVPCGGGTGGSGGVGGFGGAGGSGGFTGDCCQPQPWPGCGDLAVTSCVCQADPFCCQTQWDGVCVSEVTQLGCGMCGGTGGSAGFGGGGGSGGVGQCVAQAPDDCGKCLCVACFDQLGACIADFGCPVILDCAQKAGCSGVDCYQPNTCQSVIDSFGGPFGASAQKALQLVSCSVQSSCPCN